MTDDITERIEHWVEELAGATFTEEQKRLVRLVFAEPDAAPIAA